jgi:hypothetical protein
VRVDVRGGPLERGARVPGGEDDVVSPADETSPDGAAHAGPARDERDGSLQTARPAAG